MSAAIRAELRKFFTTRMWWGMAIAMFVAGVVFAVAFGFLLTQPPSAEAQAQGLPSGSPEQVANSVYTSGLQVGYLLTLVIGIMQIGSEYRHKTITGTFLGTFAQAPLGAVTVHYNLDPYLVVSHLVLALVALALGVLVLLEATRLVRGGGSALPALARSGGATLLAAVGVLVVSGTLSTAAGRFPGSSGSQVVERIWVFHSAVYWHVRAVAAFGIVFLVLAGWAWRERARFPWLVRGCAGLLVILAAQMVVGEVQYRTYGTVPWLLVVVHVVAAASLFAWTVGLVARLWRPVSHD